MGFVPIRMDEFIKLHRKSNPGERPDEFITLLRRSVADARQGARCHCGAPIWAIGSAVVGNACFTCITGEADPSSDYEIDEVLKGRGGETLAAQGVADDQQAKPSDRADGIKTRKPKSEDASVIDARVRHQLSRAQIQIARGLAMNPKKLGEADKY